MRSAILGAVGLVLGVIGALGYSHFLGEGKQLAGLQDQLTKLQAELASAQDASKLAKTENDALSTQVKQLIASKDQLQKQGGSGQNSGTFSFPGLPNMNKADMAGIVKAQMSQVYEQRLQMLISRLHLTPDQIAQIKAAMDDEEKRTEEMSAKMLSGQKVNIQDMMKDAKNIKPVEQTIQDLLTPDQKVAYKKMQDDQKTSQAESSASMEMNQIAPLLNLSDTQKDQVESALYQVHLDSGSPDFAKKYPTDPADPLSFMGAQEKAKEDALASILTPDQMAAYKQQTESQLNMQRNMMKKFMPPGGFSSLVTGASTTTTSTPAAPTPAPNQTPAPAPAPATDPNQTAAPNP